MNACYRYMNIGYVEGVLYRDRERRLLTGDLRRIGEREREALRRRRL